MVAELAEIRSLGASHPGGGVLFLDVDGSMRASDGCGNLDPGALAALQVSGMEVFRV